MSDERFGYGEFMIGTLTGLILGFGLGVILAPQPGTATREDIAHRAGDLKHSADDLVGQAKKYIDLATNKVEGVLGLEEIGTKRRLKELRAELEKYELDKA